MSDYLRLADIERLPGSRFRHDNSVNWNRIGTPVWRDTASGLIVVEKPFILIGWCDSVPSNLMVGRDGQIGLMLWHSEYEYVWEHYPLFDDEDREAAKFVSR